MKPLPYVGRCLLKQLLEQKRMTASELANKSEISLQRISDYKSNRRGMSLTNARKIAQVLNCYIDDLYDWSE